MHEYLDSYVKQAMGQQELRNGIFARRSLKERLVSLFASA